MVLFEAFDEIKHIRHSAVAALTKLVCSQGIAAAVCHHEFVLVAVNLFTNENFVYYELIVNELLRLYDSDKGRKLHTFFLDIAC